MMTKACEDLRRCNKADFVPMGGMPVLLSVLKTHCEDASVNQAGWETVSRLARHSDFAEIFVKEGFVHALVAALKFHYKHPGVIEVACDTAYTMFVFSSDSKASFTVASGGFLPHHHIPPTHLTLTLHAGGHAALGSAGHLQRLWEEV